MEQVVQIVYTVLEILLICLGILLFLISTFDFIKNVLQFVEIRSCLVAHYKRIDLIGLDWLTGITRMKIGVVELFILVRTAIVSRGLLRLNASLQYCRCNPSSGVSVGII